MTPSQATVPVASVTPAQTSTTPTPKAGAALAAVARLTVKGRAPKTGYTRAQFGQAWFDTDRNGCDTRNDILRRDLTSRQMQNACKVLAGTLAPDPYTGTSIRFVYGGASEVDIDHVVALSDAWQKGAASWPAGKRLALANDPLNLLAVDSLSQQVQGRWRRRDLAASQQGLPLHLRRETGRGEGQVRRVGHRSRARRHDPRPHCLPDHALAGAGLRINRGGAAPRSVDIYASTRRTDRTGPRAGTAGQAVANCTAMHVDYKGGVGRTRCR